MSRQSKHPHEGDSFTLEVASHSDGGEVETPTTDESASNRSRGSYLWILAALTPIPLLVVSRAWTLVPAGWIDAYAYLGYFDWLGGLGYFSDNYKSSRIPWLAIGWLANHALGPYWGVILLAAACISTCAVLTFLIARLAWPLWLALLAAFGFAYWPFLYNGGGGGWMYHNTLLAPVMLLGILSAIVMSRTPGRVRACSHAMVVGVCLLISALLTTHAAVLLVIAIIMSIASFRWLPIGGARQPTPSIRWILVGIAGGALLAFSLCSALAALAGNSPLFYRPLLAHLRAPSTKSVWWEPLSSGWLTNAAYLGPVAVAAFVALAGLALRAWRGRRCSSWTEREITCAALASTSLFALLAYATLYTAGFQSLDSSYIAFPLQVSSLVGLIGGVGLCLSSRTRSRPPALAPWSLATAAFVGLVGPAMALALSNSGYLGDDFSARPSPLWNSFLWFGLLVGSILAIRVILARVPRRSLSSPLIDFALPMVLLSLWLPGAMALGPGITNFQPVVRCNSNAIGSEIVLALRQRLVTSPGAGSLPKPTMASIWADPTALRAVDDVGATCLVKTADVVTSVFVSLHTPQPLSGSFDAAPITAIPSQRLRDAANSGGLVLVASNPSNMASALERVRHVTGARASLFAQTTFAAGGAHVWVAIQQAPAPKR